MAVTKSEASCILQ